MDNLVDQPRKLFVDIETSLMVGAFWQPGQQYVGTKQILKEREVMVIGYAWDNEPVQALTFDMSRFSFTSRDDEADMKMLEDFGAIYTEADLVIGHNVKAFDIAVLRARLIKHGLPDLSPVLIDDSYQQMKGIGFSGHSLDYVTQFLGIGKKDDHPYELWLEILIHQSQEALDAMVTYCKGDVERNRRMYETLRPYTKSSLNMATFLGDVQSCPNCGAHDSLIVRGHRHTRTGKYTRYFCKVCRTYPTIGDNLITKSSMFPR